MTRNEYYAINFKAEQRRAIKIANELYYGKGVIEKLNNATTVDELSRILKAAREARI